MNRKLGKGQILVILKVVFSSLLFLVIISFLGSLYLELAVKGKITTQILIFSFITLLIILSQFIISRRAFVYYLILYIMFLGMIIVLLEITYLNFIDQISRQLIFSMMVLLISLIIQYSNRRVRLAKFRKENFGKGKINPEYGLWDLRKRIQLSPRAAEGRFVALINNIGKYILPLIPALGFYFSRTYGVIIRGPVTVLFLTYISYFIGLLCITHIAICFEILSLERIYENKILLCTDDLPHQEQIQ